jgi:hypothetical protein
MASFGAVVITAMLGTAHAQQQYPSGGGYPPGGYPPPQQGYPPPYQQGGYGQAQPGAYGPPPYQRSSRARSPAEIGTLYGFSAAYGIGLGVWFSSEIGIEDPGLFLLPPLILGVAAPVGVFFLDQPDMDAGLPAAITVGMMLGAGEGMGIATYQIVTSDKRDAWGFRGFSRAAMLGATLGAGAGYAFGYYGEPPPETSLMTGSAAVWGTAIGAMYGYGASAADIGYGRANDSAGLGGLIGFNAGAVIGAGMGALFVPSTDMVAWMWLGAGIGAAVSLPVFLFYAGEDTPPAKRGLLFMATATLLGIAAGGVFSSEEADLGGKLEPAPSLVRLDYVVPAISNDSVGLQLGGVLY